MALQDYETVATRLEKWWADQPHGRVLTRIVESTGTAWTILAEVYDDRDDDRPSATGMAHGDPQGAKGAQATNPLEDGETSAIGRALANRGYAPSGARPSREEMQVAQAREGQPQQRAEFPFDPPTDNQVASLKEQWALLSEADADRFQQWIRRTWNVDSLREVDTRGWQTVIEALVEHNEQAAGDTSEASAGEATGEETPF